MTNIDYVSAETAKLLKEVGYREFKGKTLIGEYNMVHLWDAQKWLREEYGIHIEVQQYAPLFDPLQFHSKLFWVGERNYWRSCYCDYFETYELALDAGITYVCEMIKNGKIKK